MNGRVNLSIYKPSESFLLLMLSKGAVFKLVSLSSSLYWFKNNMDFWRSKIKCFSEYSPFITQNNPQSRKVVLKSVNQKPPLSTYIIDKSNFYH